MGDKFLFRKYSEYSFPNKDTIKNSQALIQKIRDAAEDWNGGDTKTEAAIDAALKEAREAGLEIVIEKNKINR